MSKQGSTITSKNKDWFFRRNKAINIELEQIANKKNTTMKQLKLSKNNLRANHLKINYISLMTLGEVFEEVS
nr:hypothetical protein [Mycoplasmopsis bovis]